MFIVTAKLNALRRALLLVVLLIAAAAAVFVLFRFDSDAGDALPRAATAEERVAYLSSLGWEVDQEPLESLRMTLPETLDEPYLTYNELQRRQGFDLSAFCGKTVERYTYRVRNYPDHPDDCQADLYLCRGRVIAGDIVCTGTNGFIDTLTAPQ